MTTDEELNWLEDGLRRLKIEYETYFNGGSPRPPNDLVFRVEKIIKKHNASTMEMNFRQRFQFNQLAQSYAIHNDLWRKKLKLKEEGAPSADRGHAGSRPADEAFSVTWSDPARETWKVEELLEAVAQARSAVGLSAVDLDPQLFAEFIGKKTLELKQSLSCDSIRFSVSVEEGRVTLRASRSD